MSFGGQFQVVQSTACQGNAPRELSKGTCIKKNKNKKNKKKFLKKNTATAISVNSTDKNTLLVNPPHINVYLVKYERERKTDHLIVLLQRTFNKEFPMK